MSRGRICEQSTTNSTWLKSYQSKVGGLVTRWIEKSEGAGAASGPEPMCRVWAVDQGASRVAV